MGASAQLRQLASLRLKDGGLAFGGIRRGSASAFLASWAFCFKEVAGVVGLQGFRSRCPGVAGVLDVAETTLRTQGRNWVRALTQFIDSTSAVNSGPFTSFATLR